MKVTERTLCNPLSLNCVSNTYFEPLPVHGDGTVPVYSSRRISFSTNLNSPDAKRYFVNAVANPSFSDENAEHTKMTANSRVHATLNKILRNVDSSDVISEDSSDSIAATDLPTNQSLYVSVKNASGFKAGGSNQPTFGPSGLNGLQAVPTSENSVWIAMPATTTYSVMFVGNGEPISATIIKGVNYEQIERQVQYSDIVLPENTVAELEVSSSGNTTLRFDSDDNGQPDTTIEPTAIIEGTHANDIEPPTISVDYTDGAGTRTVSLTANDADSGVRKVYYSLNGESFAEYSSPVSVGLSQAEIWVFAEDNNRNRTGIAPFKLGGAAYSIGNRVWYDVNNNGKIDQGIPAEVGINGVSLSLFEDSNQDGQPDGVAIKTTLSDGQGYYRFDNLLAGHYVVRVDPVNFGDLSLLAGYKNTTLQTTDSTDSDVAHAGENGITPPGASNALQTVGILSNTIELGPALSEPTGETDLAGDDSSVYDSYADLTVDFGFYRLELGGTIWIDSGPGSDRDNGYFDYSEMGAAGFRVKLFSDNIEVPVGPDGILGTSDDSSGGVLTNTSGDYTFRGLLAGSYTVKVDRNGVNSSSVSSQSPNNNIDYDNNGANGVGADSETIVSSTIALTEADRGALENTEIDESLGFTTNRTLDFGVLYVPTAGVATISGVVRTSFGHGIGQAVVHLQNAGTGVSQYRTTNTLG
ncbi:MAG TPA: SdrD B-like domain-containing protein, partial [Pyrinomonadaceae bacterium]|nr:SdrD B-like domain-containing protein [Pyrinomonadaceae bacterium]